MDFESHSALQDYLGCTSTFARLLWARGLRSQAVLDTLLNPKLSGLPAPFSIIDMERAVDRVVDALANEEGIVIYGDYDVDGTCGAAILFDFFRTLGAPVRVYQPNRFTEGYGINVPAVQRLLTEPVGDVEGTGGVLPRIMISVDCGITAVEPARVCREQGCDLIILDHHLPGTQLPEAFAVVDPQRPEDTSSLGNLCGAGLAFFFIMGLRAKLRDVGFFEDRGGEPNLLKYLDLVATATVADVADIRGVNRILVHHGLRVLNTQPRVGLKALLEAARVQRLQTYHLGFVLGPRINAAGRLSSAKSALSLLISTDLVESKRLAQELEDINAARRNTQDEVLQEARVQARTQLQDPQWIQKWAQLAEDVPAAAFAPWPRALVLANERWHEGVLGIVASKIVEEFGLPTFVLAGKEGEPVWKGSARSLPKIDIFSAMQAESVAMHLLNFGGHAHAGGASLAFERLEDFRQALNHHLALVTTAETYQKQRRFDLEIEPQEVTPQFLSELETLEPFGHKFPEPVFKMNGCVPQAVKILKEKHLKFKVRGLDALWFQSVKDDGSLPFTDGSSLALWVSPQWNEWQGVRKLQLKVSHSEGAT